MVRWWLIACWRMPVSLQSSVTLRSPWPSSQRICSRVGALSTTRARAVDLKLGAVAAAVDQVEPPLGRLDLAVLDDEEPQLVVRVLQLQPEQVPAPDPDRGRLGAGQLPDAHALGVQGDLDAGARGGPELAPGAPGPVVV